MILIFFFWIFFASFKQVYKEFERRILQGTREYYLKQSTINMDKFYNVNNSFVEYLQCIRTLIDDEMRERAVLMHQSTEDELKKVLSETLIQQHLEVFDTEFRVRFFLFKSSTESIKLISNMSIRFG